MHATHNRADRADRWLSALVAPLLLAGCGAGGDDDTAPIQPTDAVPEIVFARSNRDSFEQNTELRVRSRQGLSERRAVPERRGAEHWVRVHPDGNRILYTRDTRTGDISSREIFIGTLDGSAGEARVTNNRVLDEEPCWMGDRILFMRDRETNGSALWSMALDGSDERRLLTSSETQLDPDSNADGSLVVYAERPPGNLRTAIWLLETTSGRTTQITDAGGVATASVAFGPIGDLSPALSPDGNHVLFTRDDTSIQGAPRRLMQLDRSSGVVTVLGNPVVTRDPRWSPRQDAIFAARELGDGSGIEGWRLFELDVSGSDPLLLSLDKRFDDLSFDPLPGMAVRPALSSPARIDSGSITATTVFGVGSTGNLERIDDADDVVLSVFSGVSGDRDVAALRVRARVTDGSPLDIARFRVFVRMGVSRTDPDGVIRMTLDNPSASRNDTVIELSPTDGSLQTYTFTSQSLAHISRDGTITLTVITDMPTGDRVELAVDQVAVEVWERAAAQTQPLLER